MSEYESAGAIISEDLGPASLVMAVKTVRNIFCIYLFTYTGILILYGIQKASCILFFSNPEIRETEHRTGLCMSKIIYFVLVSSDFFLALH